jgi:hypothetical protein
MQIGLALNEFVPVLSEGDTRTVTTLVEVTTGSSSDAGSIPAASTSLRKLGFIEAGFAEAVVLRCRSAVL